MALKLKSAVVTEPAVEDDVSFLIDTGNVDGITALLKNHSAKIREETLDAIIDAAQAEFMYEGGVAHWEVCGKFIRSSSI
jgi:hypothetical protein